MIKALSLACLALLLDGCSMSSQNTRSVANYDLGVATTASVKPLTAHLVIADIEAPQWLQGRGILYRLAYQNDKQLQAYASSQWVAPPTELLSLRLRQYFASDKASSPQDRTGVDFMLRIELEAFEQLFTAPATSQGVLRAKATLVNALERRLTAQKTFVIEQPSASADAAGGVSALSAASAQLMQAVHEWLGAAVAQTAAPGK